MFKQCLGKKIQTFVNSGLSMNYTKKILFRILFKQCLGKRLGILFKPPICRRLNSISTNIYYKKND